MAAAPRPPEVGQVGLSVLASMFKALADRATMLSAAGRPSAGIDRLYCQVLRGAFVDKYISSLPRLRPASYGRRPAAPEAKMSASSCASGLAAHSAALRVAAGLLVCTTRLPELLSWRYQRFVRRISESAEVRVHPSSHLRTLSDRTCTASLHFCTSFALQVHFKCTSAPHFCTCTALAL